MEKEYYYIAINMLTHEVFLTNEECLDNHVIIRMNGIMNDMDAEVLTEDCWIAIDPK